MAKTITTNILINAKQNGLTQIGDTLTVLGSIVDGMSQKLIDMGKGSLDVYKNFEYNMAQAKIALATTYGKGTSALNNTMDQLTEAAAQWASTSIFHTDDVSNAIMEAARGGLNLEQILSTIPAAMELAQAGGVDLSVGLDQLMTTANALGLSVEEIPAFADNWAYAANSSMTNIEEMGEAMMKMGATMQFGDSNAEIMTMIGILSDAGTKGEAAGTLLRNSMLRLINPTKKAKEVMAGLGVTEEEMAEAQADSAEALETLTARGFSAYENGRLKPMLQTYGELYDILVDINGSAEDLQGNEEVNSILGAIFPTRSITGALALLQAASEGFELYGQITENADGYGEFAAETAMNTFVGKEETFLSKFEELQRRVGQELAPQVEGVYQFVGEVMDLISGMDEGVFSALVGGLEGLAALGPGLLITGGAMRLVGAAIAAPELAATVAAIAGLVTVTGALVSIAREYTDIENAFGTMSLDTTQIENSLSTVQKAYEDAYKEVDAYNQQLTEAYKQFADTSGSLSSMLSTKLITGSTLSSKDKEILDGLGDQMGQALIGGVQANFDGMIQSIYQTFGGDASMENPTFHQIMDVMAQGYEDEIARAQNLSQQLRDAMTSAFQDGHLNADELENIQSIISQMNELFAQQINRERAEQEAEILYKAQTMSVESLRQIDEMVAETRENTVGKMVKQFAGDLYDVGAMYDRAIQSGGKIGVYDSEGNYITDVDAMETMKETALTELKAQQDKQLAEYESSLTSLTGRAYMTAIRQNFGDEWSGFYDSMQASGGYVSRDVREGLQTNDLDTALNMMIESMGGMEALARHVSYLGSIGDEAGMREYGTIYNTASTLRGQNEGLVDVDTSVLSEITATLSAFGDASYSIEEIKEAMSSFGGFEGLSSELQGSLMSIAEASTAYEGNADSVTQMIEDAIATADKVVEVEGDATQLSDVIEALNGMTLTETVTGDTGPLRNAINQVISEASSRVITIPVTTGGTKDGYAEGGRATVASIFGEAGPEWAIPEQHTDRTAELLNAARAASGFTWTDLISRFGGLGANANNKSTTLVYSPTINAGNAQGIEQALIADKARLERWWEDKQTREAVEVYA